jgi:hypothetical protein
MRVRETLAFHDLQIYRDGGTHGTGGKDVSLETAALVMPLSWYGSESAPTLLRYGEAAVIA